MRRREFVVGLAGVAVVGPFGARAQKFSVPAIGFLTGRSSKDADGALNKFREGMRELGYIEGKSFLVEARNANGQYGALPALAEQLANLKVDVIVAIGSPAVRAAQRATSTIPIVIGSTGDAVASGLVASLSRPGGNTTGLSSLITDVVTKQLQLLLTTLPGLSRIAVLSNPGSATRAPALQRVEQAGQTKGVVVTSVDVSIAADVDRGFAMMNRERIEGLIIFGDSLIFSQLPQIAKLAADSKIPSAFGFREYPDAGGLFSYGASINEEYRRAATYVDKILKGAKPADLPVEQPNKFELVINLKTAKAIGLEIPSQLLLTADEVIE